MGRKLGSKNKISNISKVIELSKYIENTPIINDESAFEWVTYGKKNNFPNILLDLYYNSPVHKACVDFVTTAVLGQGIEGLDETETRPNSFDTWDIFMEKIVSDFVIYGAFSFQVIKNKDGKTYSYYHQPISTVRLGKKDENGDIKYGYLCKDWMQATKFRPTKIDILNFTDDVKIALGKPYLFYFSNYNPFDPYYGTPTYASALDAIKADIEMGKYDLNSITNLFTPSGMLTLNRIEDEQERLTVLRNIEKMFTGADNAGRMIITFKNSDSDEPVQFTPFSAPSSEVNLFADTNERTINRILAAHRIPSKALIGLPMDSTGFSNEGSLLEVAYNLFEKTTISGYRKTIVGIINQILALNGIDTMLEIKPLSFNLSDLDNETREVVQDPKNEEVDDENIDYDKVKY